jgi:vitamin B12 transporter
VQKLSPFDVVNVSASFDVTKLVQVYARVDNLFSEKYEEILNFGTPIRSVFGGVRVSL